MGCSVIPGAGKKQETLELADIVRQHGHELQGLRPVDKRILQAIVRCRTAALGGNRRECDKCGHSEFAYYSCYDRHCPKCQGLAAAEWVEARREDLLPVEYFHVVFTIPEVLNELFLHDPKTAHGLLFSAVSETLQEVAANPEHLGARIGFISVLHTWTQKLLYHPHIHCIVAGGGLSQEGSEWIATKRRFLLPVLVLSKVFRGKLLAKLEKATRSGKLEISQPKPAVLARLKQAAEPDWVVYCKPPFAGPEQVLKYLGQYTHRIGISNHRLISLESGEVTFRYKDRVNGNKTRTMKLPALEFLRRFLLHVVPKGLVRIRHYGFLANAVRRASMARVRELLGVSDPPANPAPEGETWQERLLRLTGVDVLQCPKCADGRLKNVAILAPMTPTSVQIESKPPT